MLLPLHVVLKILEEAATDQGYSLVSNVQLAFLKVAKKAGAELPSSLRKDALCATLAYLRSISREGAAPAKPFFLVVHLCSETADALLRPVPGFCDVDPALIPPAIDAAMEPFTDSKSAIPLSASSPSATDPSLHSNQGCLPPNSSPLFWAAWSASFPSSARWQLTERLSTPPCSTAPATSPPSCTR